MDRSGASDGIAVVSVIRWPGEALDRFLDSLKSATTRPVRVVLADLTPADGPDPRDGAAERAAARDGVQLLCVGEDIGPGAGANRGVAELGPDVAWIAIVDVQIEWGEGALDELLAAAARHPRAGALGPLVRDPAGARQRTAGALPPARVLPALAEAVLRGRRRPEPPVAGPVGWLSGWCLLLRRAAWESVDGFDPRYLGSFGGVDLGDRLGRAGWLCVYVPTAEVVQGSGRPGTDRTLEGPERGLRRYLADRHPAPGRAALAIAARLRAGYLRGPEQVR